MADIVLELQGITKKFGHTVAADHLSLEIKRGEFFTFLGPSGSGKSTILRMVAGLEKPDGGRIFLEGRDVSQVPPWHRNLGMMFQQYAVFPHMTVAQNVEYGLKLRNLDLAERQARVDRMLDLVGLAGMRAKNATLLSGGEQQRVALARALAPEPRMLLLDEPLSARAWIAFTSGASKSAARPPPPENRRSAWPSGPRICTSGPKQQPCLASFRPKSRTSPTAARCSTM
jgi:ABC-type Fe3+/spermidine/putrescine transport system ATPase subunit